MAKEKVDKATARHALTDLNQGLRALHSLAVSAPDGHVNGEVLSICVEQMSKEMLRQVNIAYGAVGGDVSMMFGDVDSQLNT